MQHVPHELFQETHNLVANDGDLPACVTGVVDVVQDLFALAEDQLVGAMNAQGRRDLDLQLREALRSQAFVDNGAGEQTHAEPLFGSHGVTTAERLFKNT